MVKGWFIGDFEPTCLRTQDVEVACKKYNAGDHEARHFHKVATEVTLVVSGSVKMCEHILGEGDMIVLSPGESADFLALEDAVTVVVKLPSVLGDKYEA